MNTLSSKLFFLAILSVCLMVPLSNDIFISGLPAMKSYFQGANVALVLSVGLLGLSLAQLVYGPLLDRFGRRPILLVGLWIFTIASAVTTFSHSFHVLLIARFIQAIGACSSIVTVFAIVRDVYEQDKLIKATGVVTALIGISPALAPLVGSAVNNVWGWRASFAVLFLLGLIYVLLTQFFFKETQAQKNLSALNFRHIFNNYTALLRNIPFLIYGISSGLSYGVLFSYFAISPFFIIHQMHFSVLSFGWIVATNAIAIIGMSILTPRFSPRLGLPKTMTLGFVFILIGGLIMWVSNIFLPTNIYTFMVPMFISTIGISIIRPTAGAGAMQLAERKVAGSASALYNFLSFMGGSIASAVTSHVVSHVASFGLFIVVMGILALLFQGLQSRLPTHVTQVT